MYPDLMFAKCSINFINSAMFSNNIVIKTITGMGMDIAAIVELVLIHVTYMLALK